MKKTTLGWLTLLALNLVAFSGLAQVAVPSTYKQITIDGSFADWSGVPLAYNAAVGVTNAIQYDNIYIANDSNNLYIRFTLYTPRPTALQNSYDNIFIDGDDNPSTGYPAGGIGSSMLIQGGAGYQESGGTFNEAGIDNLGWSLAGSSDSLDFEFSISRDVSFTNGMPVFASNTIAIFLEGDSAAYVNTEYVPPSGGLVYTFANAPTAPTANETLIGLSTSSWAANASGTDLGTNWLGANYDDTSFGWTSGDGLFGYTSTTGVYPPIQTPLISGPKTYYFINDFLWTNDSANVAFVVTNYLSDGAVYYINGSEVRRLRMPSGAISYATAATATNAAPGIPEVFGIDGSILQYGTNIFEVETHQTTPASSDMVFGLSLTAAISYPPLVVDTNLPADQSVLAGQPVTFTSDTLASGPVGYQWFLGSTAILGATGPSYTIPLVLTNNAGTYSLQVSNSVSVVTTRAATLTVGSAPIVITSEPASQVIVEGKPVTFSVVVTGTPLIAYQWFFNSQSITDATNATYTISSTLPANAGSYSVTISNPAGSTNSSAAVLTILADTIPPTFSALTGGHTTVLVTFTKPVDSVTSSDPTKYSIAGIPVIAASQNPGNPSQVTLTTGAPLAFGAVYTLTATGVKDTFGNSSSVSGQFFRDITIDGSFDDWTGIAPIYTQSAPSGNLDAADYKEIDVYNDANFYYFHVVLWVDIDPAYGQFPAYANMFFDTDNNPGTGYSAIGSDMLIQSGVGYQEKDGGFNDGFPILGLNWLCLPASPGTNFELEFSREAMFSEDDSPVFTTNLINFIFQGQTPGYTLENTVPASGELSYTNEVEPTLAALPVSNIQLSSLADGQAAVAWDGTATLQASTNVTGPWTNVANAVAPYVISSSSGSQFYRLIR